LISKKIEIIPVAKILTEVPLEVFKTLPVYNHPLFLQLVAPNKSFYAKATKSKGQSAFFPFAGQNLILKWRVFQIAFCQKFQAFTLDGDPDADHWQIWFDFLKEKVIKCQWPIGILPEIVLEGFGKAEIKTNQILNLETDFDSLLSKWKPNRKSALNKSKTLMVKQQNHADFMKGLKISVANKSSNRWKPSEKEIKIAEKISTSDFFKNDLLRFSVIENEDTLNSVLLLKWAGRFHYLFSFSSEQGLKKEALTKFFLNFLETQSNQKMLFDFEGSSIPGIQNFFTSLGAHSENYMVIKNQ
jgi:hypothetical protein